MWGIVIALLSGALMSIQGVFNTEVTKQLGRTSLIRLNLIGVSLVSNQRKPLDKALKLIELRLLMASFDLINLEVSQKKIGLICLVMGP